MLRKSAEGRLTIRQSRAWHRALKLLGTPRRRGLSKLKPDRKQKIKPGYREAADHEIRFERARSYVSEMFQDFILMVRMPDGSRMWVTTNQDWAYGACKRVVDQMFERDNARMWKEQNGGENA